MRSSDWSSDVCSSDLDVEIDDFDPGIEQPADHHLAQKPRAADHDNTLRHGQLLALGKNDNARHDQETGERARAVLVKIASRDRLGDPQDRKSTRLNSSH